MFPSDYSDTVISPLRDMGLSQERRFRSTITILAKYFGRSSFPPLYGAAVISSSTP